MKLGLITIYQVPNYGSVLQTYATQYMLTKIGHACEVVHFSYPANRKTTLRSLVYRFTTYFGVTAQQRKIKGLNKFKKERLRLTSKFNTYTDLCNNDWSIYDGFVVGSDQVWNVDYTNCDPTFLLNFLSDSCKRYSIASSFALRRLPIQFVECFKTSLSAFRALSVREENGIKIINAQLGINKDVFLCLDPTLLLSAEEWKKLSTRKEFACFYNSYILLYMWTYAFEPRPYIYDVVKRLKEEYPEYEIIALEGYCNIDKNVINELHIKNAEDSTIGEFIALFNNAKIVVTTSFHGTAFALNFGKPLLSIVPGNNDDRQSTLLKTVGAEKCAIEVGTDLNQLDPYYDTEYSLKLLEQKRQQCIEWLYNNII